MDAYCQFEHGPGNVRIALAPGDTIVTTVISGGTVQIRNSCESMQIALTHHAGVAIHHPIQADMRAARHGIDPAIQVVLESATGNVWIHQRRRQNSAAREQHNRHGRRANDDGERTNPCETEADDTTNPTPGDVPMEATPHNPHGELQGTLGQLRHVTWGSSSESATTVDHNPEVATNATHASREVLATFGTGASDDMIRDFAAWIARHVRARHATSAPNHWCWALTTVCWLISKAMQNDGAAHGLTCRAMATSFGMNAAGIRQRPLTTWTSPNSTAAPGGAPREYEFPPGTLPPGAQSTGENESVVSQTNARLSSEANTHLNRLIQSIWTEGDTGQNTNDQNAPPTRLTLK